jgi:hypothetical protein
MFQHKDEYMLLSLSGRVQSARRADPRHRHRLSAAELERAGLRPARGRLKRWASGLRGTGTGRRADRSPAQPPGIGGEMDGESYFELEFAVGFGVEDEQLR